MGFCYTRPDFGSLVFPPRSAFVSTTIVAFYLLAAFTVASALGVALSHNIVYSAFALMGALLGAAGIFVLLGADFVGVVQLLVYVGGILVLTLFAVMLTSRVDVRVSNRAVGRLPAAAVVLVVGTAMTHAITSATWVATAPGAPKPTVYGIGSAFLGAYVLPFEVA